MQRQSTCSVYLTGVGLVSGGNDPCSLHSVHSGSMLGIQQSDAGLDSHAEWRRMGSLTPVLVPPVMNVMGVGNQSRCCVPPAGVTVWHGLKAI